MNPTAEKTDSGNKVDVDPKSTHIDNIKSIIHDKKAVLRNSAKLKSQIHSQINDLIETLKERERQLFLEIEEHELDCFISMADKKLTDLSVGTKAPDIDAKEESSTFLQKQLLKFVGSHELLKTQLQQFGKLEEMEKTTIKSSECLQQDAPDSPQVKKSRFSVNELMRKLSKKNGTKRVHKESSGSVESFEVIDGLDHDEYQKYIQSLKDEDDIEVVSNPDEFQPWQPSFPIREIGYSHEPEPNHPKDSISPVPDAPKDQHSASGNTQSPTAEEIADPVAQINKQLQSLWCSSSKDAKHLNSKAQTCQKDEPINNTLNSAFPLEQRAKSDGLSSKMTPVPSAIIQKTFKTYLEQDDKGKWLVTSEDGRKCEVSSGCLNLFSSPKGLHFKMR